MNLEITSEGIWFFHIKLDGGEHIMQRRPEGWYLDDLWLASARLDWPAALGRALHQLNKARTP
jgi:hypothetical protein